MIRKSHIKYVLYQIEIKGLVKNLSDSHASCLGGSLLIKLE